MLLVVSDKDIPNPLDYTKIFNGLRLLRRDVTLIRYPQETHDCPRLPERLGPNDSFLDT